MTRLEVSSRVLVAQADDVATEVLTTSLMVATLPHDLQPTVRHLQSAPSLAHHGTTYWDAKRDWESEKIARKTHHTRKQCGV